ncbi:glycoside hydrolase superfamily, partial [Bombardia bombarda]
TITIDAITTHQTISGFGFSEAFQRAHALTNLPPPLQTQLLDLLFNTTTGAGFSILRIGLGSSPNSTLDHMNSPQPTADGPFAFDHNDSGQLWVARQAHERYNITTFYADAWSAPGYMKTNGRDDMGGWLCGVRGAGQDPSDTNNNCQGASWVQSYAEYLARYVLAYIDAGIPISYVGFLNEPNLVKPYATMLADGYQAADIIAALYVALGGIGLPHVGIACCEAQGWSYAREMLAELEDAGAVDGLSLMTTHAYKGEPAAPDGPLGVTSMPVWITENSPIMQRLGMTETWYGNGSENEGLAWAVNIHEAIVRGNVSAYVYWIGTSGGSATTGDGALPAYTIGATYWASAQFSRFIRPGAKRIGVGQDWMEGSVLVSAYENKDGSVVVQAVNNG